MDVDELEDDSVVTAATMANPTVKKRVWDSAFRSKENPKEKIAFFYPFGVSEHEVITFGEMEKLKDGEGWLPTSIMHLYSR